MAKKAKKQEMLVVASKVKEVVKGMGLQSSGDLVEAISSAVHALLAKAGERAELNNRATMRRHDL